MKLPLATRIARGVFERKVLRLLVEAKDGSLTFGELAESFLGQTISDDLERLRDDGLVERFDGLVFHITARGRARLAESPVCVAVQCST